MELFIVKYIIFKVRYTYLKLLHCLYVKTNYILYNPYDSVSEGGNGGNGVQTPGPPQLKTAMLNNCV